MSPLISVTAQPLGNSPGVGRGFVAIVGRIDALEKKLR